MQNVPSGWTAFCYTLNGEAYFGGQEKSAPEHATLVLSSAGEQLKVETRDSTSRFILIAGKPLLEPIVQYGPFVMNTKEEIQAAFDDYHSGKNGFERAPGWTSDISKNY
jgi:redox-sensitive bicupin YhaK (pirin superfamily)